MIKTIDTSINTVKEVFFKEKLLGHFMMAEDGYYLFYPHYLEGGWSSNSLKTIESELNKLNSSIEESVDYLMKRNFEDDARVEYMHLIHSGTMFEWYPHLTGFWENDKNEWFYEYKKLISLRNGEQSNWETKESN